MRWPETLLRSIPYPGLKSGWLADPANGADWWPEIRQEYFSPLQVKNCVLYLDPSDLDTVTLTDASIVAGNDFSNAAWTKTNLTVTANDHADALGDKLEVTASPSQVSQTVTNTASNSTAQPPVVYTVKIHPFSVTWVRIATGGSDAAAYFDVVNGTVGTVNSRLSNATISAVDADGYRTISLQQNSNSGGTNVFQINMVTGDNVNVISTPANGSYMWVKEATVSQPRVSALIDVVAGISLPQASANLQLGYEATGLNGKPCVRGYGSQYHMLPVAALIAAASGDDKPLTVVCALEKVAAEDVLIGLANAASAGNANYWDLVRLDSFRLSKGDSGSNTALVTGTAMTNAPHVVEVAYSGTSANGRTDGVVTINGQAFNVGSATLDTAALFCRPRSAPAEIGSGKLGKIAVYSRELTVQELAYLRQGMGLAYTIPVAA